MVLRDSIGYAQAEVLLSSDCRDEGIIRCTDWPISNAQLAPREALSGATPAEQGK